MTDAELDTLYARSAYAVMGIEWPKAVTPDAVAVAKAIAVHWAITTGKIALPGEWKKAMRESVRNKFQFSWDMRTPLEASA
jgi:hypothetical protein